MRCRTARLVVVVAVAFDGFEASRPTTTCRRRRPPPIPRGDDERRGMRRGRRNDGVDDWTIVLIGHHREREYQSDDDERCDSIDHPHHEYGSSSFPVGSEMKMGGGLRSRWIQFLFFTWELVRFDVNSQSLSEDQQPHNNSRIIKNRIVFAP